MNDAYEHLVMALPVELREAARDDAELPRAFERACQMATAAHPALAVSQASFAEYLAARLDGDGAVSFDIGTREIADLFVACGCSAQDRAALGHFETVLAPQLTAVVQRLCRDEDISSDIVQAVREKLLVGTDERGPRNADYGGRGPLLTWLRVIAARAAVSELRKRRRDVPDDDLLFSAASPGVDPEIALLKQRAAADIKEAFHHAFGELTARQRNLLRQHLIDGLTIDELGALYRTHRVTAARWLSKARAELWAHTRRRLRARLGLSGTQIDSLLDEVRSTLDLSIERVLAG